MPGSKDREDDESLPESLTNTRFSTRLEKFGFVPLSKTIVHTTIPVEANKIDSGKIASEVTGKSDTLGTTSQRRAHKRQVDQDSESTSSPIPSKRRTTTKDRSANDPYEPPNKLVDSLRGGLMLVFIGLNPGLETARTGHAYAHSTNQFWPLLHNSGITPVRHKAADTQLMPELYNIGNTNLCARATRSGDGLGKQEQLEGAKIVEEKIAKYKPEAVCIVGKGIWDTIYKSKTGKVLKRQDFTYGWQDEKLWLGRAVYKKDGVVWAGARTFVCTSTSGLAADTKPAEKLAIMSGLGDWVKQRRAELASSSGENEATSKLHVEGKAEFGEEKSSH